jgi:hypothetical protein
VLPVRNYCGQRAVLFCDVTGDSVGTYVPLLMVKEAALSASIRHKGQRRVTNHHSPGCTHMVLGWNRNPVSEIRREHAIACGRHQVRVRKSYAPKATACKGCV